MKIELELISVKDDIPDDEILVWGFTENWDCISVVHMMGDFYQALGTLQPIEIKYWVHPPEKCYEQSSDS